MVSMRDSDHMVVAWVFFARSLMVE
jgi:hypothetical protein